jgi:glycosyltransferase involved in cell wall biosynthesis
MCPASRLLSPGRDAQPALVTQITFEDNRPPMSANVAPNLSSRSAVLLHRGGTFVRGTEAVLIRSANALAAAGYRLVICRRNACIDAPLASIDPRPEFVDFQFPELMISGIRETSFPIGAYIKAFRQLRELVGRSRARLIYCSGGLPAQLAVPVARLANIPVLCHFHHPAPRRAHYLWLSRFADKRVFPSDFVQRHSPSDRKNPGTVLYNGIDVMRFRPAALRDDRRRAHWGIATDAVVVGQVGALARNKRPDFLISAVSPLLKLTQRKFHLCLVGAGPMEGDLRRLVAELGLAGKVTLTGYVDDVLPYYQHVFDINVLASMEEGLGISVIEGSACGLPAVVSNCTGLPETIIDGESGHLFDVNDAEGLRGHLTRLAESPSLRASMGRAGRALAEERFSSTAYDEKFMAVVDDLLKGT